MEKKTRYVKFDYFQPYIVNYETIKEKGEKGRTRKVQKIKSEKPFDVTLWMEEMQNKPLVESEIFYQQDKIRVDDVYVEPRHQFGIIHFTRLRDSNVPAITSSLLRQLKDIGLGEDEYIAEDISCLYDSEINVLMVQRNFYGLSPSGISYYMNQFVEDENSIIELRPICYKNAFNRGKGKSRYRKFTLKTADISKDPTLLSLDNPISKAYKELQGLNGYDIEITVKTTRDKSQKLHRQSIEKTLKDFESHKKSFKKVEVGFKETIDSRVETVDLLQGKIFSVLSFQLVPKTFLNPEVVQKDMINEYKKKNGAKNKILKNIPSI